VSERTQVVIGGRELAVSNLDKVMWPATETTAAVTKAHVIDYYVRIAPVLLPHIAGRPLTMIRFPDGVDGPSFFEKRCPDHRPEWMQTVRLGRDGKDKVVDHCNVTDVAGLAWLANMASLELHTSLAREPDTFTPTCVVFDLDPGAPADAATCARVALLLREGFERLGLQSWVKTSGSKGLQAYVPLHTPTTYDATRGFALAIGQVLERVHPELVTTNMSKDERPGKVFLDWSQNHLTKTTVSVYSLRARPRPTVSTPLTWDEVSDAADTGHASGLVFTADDALARVTTHGDLFAPVESTHQQLPPLG